MNIIDLLIGKKTLVKASDGTNIEAELTIAKIDPQHHSRNLEEPTRANDWYPASESWTTYTVHFTNGGRKTYDSLESIKII